MPDEPERASPESTRAWTPKLEKAGPAPDTVAMSDLIREVASRLSATGADPTLVAFTAAPDAVRRYVREATKERLENYDWIDRASSDGPQALGEPDARLTFGSTDGSLPPAQPPAPPPPPTPPSAGSGGGHNDGMESRLSAVEQSIARIDATLPTLGTKAEIADLKADVQKGFADQTKWIIGSGFAGIAVFITVMTFVLNNAVPKVAPQAAPTSPPVVIYLPATAPVPAPGPAASRSATP